MDTLGINFVDPDIFIPARREAGQPRRASGGFQHDVVLLNLRRHGRYVGVVGRGAELLQVNLVVVAGRVRGQQQGLPLQLGVVGRVHAHVGRGDGKGKGFDGRLHDAHVVGELRQLVEVGQGVLAFGKGVVEVLVGQLNQVVALQLVLADVVVHDVVHEVLQVAVADEREIKGTLHVSQVYKLEKIEKAPAQAAGAVEKK